jgi:chemotaxis protein MotB
MRRISDDLSKILQQQDDDQKSIQIEVTPDGLRINVYDRSQKPIFEPDTDVFTSYGTWVFSTLAWEIARYKSFKIELQGHTGVNAETGREANSKWELSTERANAARRKLEQNGVAKEQICKVSGFADTAPMPDLPATAEANRRVTVLLKMKESVNAMSASASATPGQ